MGGQNTPKPSGPLAIPGQNKIRGITQIQRQKKKKKKGTRGRKEKSEKELAATMPIRC